jgi:hypothetical protein
MKNEMNPWAETRGSDSAPLAYKGVNELSRSLGESFLCGDLQKDLHSSIRGFLGCLITPIGVTLNSVTTRPRPEVEARAFDPSQRLEAVPV